MTTNDWTRLPGHFSHSSVTSSPSHHYRFHKSSIMHPNISRQLTATLRNIGHHFGFKQIILYLADGDHSDLIVYAAYGLPQNAEPHTDIGRKADEGLYQVLRTGKPARWIEPANEETFDAETPAPRVMLALPLAAHGQILGVLAAQERGLSEKSKTDESILTCLSDLLMDILHQTLILEESQQRIEQLSVLNEITRTMSANIQINDLLETIYEQVGRVIETSTYFVSLWDKESNALVLEILYDEGIRYPKRTISVQSGLSGWIVQHRKPLRLNDLQNDMRRLGITSHRAGKAAPSQSWLGVPMIHGEHLIGVLAVASYEKGAFSLDDEVLLTSVASQAAIAIENAHLYEQAREQLAEIQNAQEQMISMSRLATSAELAAGLGHEINNALTPILGVTQLALRRKELDDELRSDLSQVFASAQRIRHIVRTFSEMTAGFTLPSQRKNVNAIVLEALELFKWRLEHHGISLDLSLSDGLHDISCDILQLRQAIANVLLNAIEAMPEGGWLRISSTSRDSDVCVVISDTGIGIHPDDLDRVFDPWFTTKVEDGRARGLGLGLFATYNVIKAHGGRVKIESRVNQGTSVRIYLPQA